MLAKVCIITYLYIGDDKCTLLSCCDSTLYLLDKSTGSILVHYRGHVLEDVRSEGGLTKNDDWVLGGDEKGNTPYIAFKICHIANHCCCSKLI